LNGVKCVHPFVHVLDQMLVIPPPSLSSETIFAAPVPGLYSSW